MASPILRPAVLALLLATAVPCAFAACNNKLGLDVSLASTYRSGSELNMTWAGTGSFQSMAYDGATKLLGVLDGRRTDDGSTPLALLVLDLSDPAQPAFVRRILFSEQFGNKDNTTRTPFGVAIWRGFAAVTFEPNANADYNNDTILRIFDMKTGVQVGGMILTGCSVAENVHWSQDGKTIITTCEGEPDAQSDPTSGSDPTIGANPEGGIAIVKVSTWTQMIEGAPQLSFVMRVKRIITFQPWFDSISEGRYKTLLAGGLRIDPRLKGGKSEAGKDIEPETITFNAKSRKIWVTLQENNAIAVIDMTPGYEKVLDIWPLGWKSYGDYEADLSDKNGPKLKVYPNTYGWPMPDYIKWIQIGDDTYVMTANEGDAKSESLRASALPLDPSVFPNGTQADAELGRVNVDPLHGIVGGYNASKPWNKQGPYDKLIGYGGRSWSIYNAKTGERVYDSGSDFERFFLTSPVTSMCFNCDRTANTVDARSDDSGPEPEALDAFSLGGRSYALIGSERMSGFFVYDVTNPRRPIMGDYVVQRNFTAPAATPTDKLGDLAPEVIKFVPAAGSGNKKALILVANEVSATVNIYTVARC